MLESKGYGTCKNENRSVVHLMCLHKFDRVHQKTKMGFPRPLLEIGAKNVDSSLCVVLEIRKIRRHQVAGKSTKFDFI